MPNVGYASLQVIPSVRGIAQEIRRQLGSVQEEGRRAGGGFGEAFSGALAAIGLAEVASKIGEQVAGAFADAVDQANLQGRMQAQLGTTPAVAARYGKVAGQLYTAGVTDSFETATGTIKEIVGSGLLPTGATDKQIKALGTQFSDFTSTFEQDTTMTAQAVKNLMVNGLAKNGTDALDLLTTGFQKFGSKADDLTETFQEYSPQLVKLGLTGKDALGIISQGLGAGARSTDLIADAMKEFSIRAIDGSKGTADGFKALGLDADSMASKIAKGGSSAAAGLDLTLDRLRGIKDPVAQSQAAVSLFGTQAEDLGRALFALDPSKAVSALGAVGGSAGKLGGDLRDGPIYELQTFQRTAKQALVDFIGGRILPALTSAGKIIGSVLAGPLKTVRQGITAMGAAFKAGGTDVTSSGLPGLFERIGLAARFLSDTALGGVRALFAAFKAGGSDVTSSGFAGVMERIGLAARFLSDTIGPLLLPALSILGSVVSTALTGVLLPAVNGVFNAIGWLADLLRDAGTWLIPVGIAIAGFTLAMTASRIATALTAGVFNLYRAAILLWTGAQRGATIAQLAFNAVMNANPVILVITAIVALGAALVIAYQKVGWFRAAVDAAWSAISTAALWLWNVVLKPVFDALKVALSAVGAAFSWLWTNIISPVFAFIGAAIKIWWAVVSAIFTVAVAVVRKVLGAVFLWLWNSVIKPVWGWISAYVGTQWAIIKAIFSAIGGFLRATLGPAFTWLRDKVITPVWNAIKSAISTVWNGGIKPVFDKLKSAVGTIGDSFGTARDAIKKAWDKIRDATKAPVNFVLDTVWNNGLLKAWNAVSGWVGLDKYKLQPLKLLAAGGTVGAGWGRSATPGVYSKPTAIVGEGRSQYPEYVIPTDPKYRGRAQALWHSAGTQLLAKGGVIGDIWGGIKGAAGSAWNGVKGAADVIAHPSKALKKLFSPVLGKLNDLGGGRVGQVAAQIPRLVVGGMKDLVTSTVGKLVGPSGGAGDIGGSGVQRWSSVVLQALKLVGQPASMLGITLRRMNQESGGNPRAINLTDINAKNGDPSRGLMQTIGATFNAYAGPLRGRGIWDPLANIYASMRYALSRYGSLAAAYNRPGGYASGTTGARRGLAWVGELGPELVDFRGGETVYNHLDSQRMARTDLAGYATGTASAAAKVAAAQRRVNAAQTAVDRADRAQRKARTKAQRAAAEREALAAEAQLKAARTRLAAAKRELSNAESATKAIRTQLATGLGTTLGTGTVAQIKSATKALITQLLKMAGSASLVSEVNKTSAKLQAAAAKRDSIAAKIAAAKSFAADQKKTVADSFGLGSISDPTGVNDLIAQLTAKQTTAKNTKASITALTKRGLSKDLISQLIGLGPDSPLGGMLATASGAQIKQLNELAKSGAKLSTSYGNQMADLLYDSGKNASRGFLTGLLSQESEAAAAAERLADLLVKTLKKKLKIHSPSALLHDEVGVQTGAGVVEGMDATAASVAAAATRMAAAAVPTLPTMALSAAAAVGTAATRDGRLQAGQRLYLVLSDGRQLDAYVDTRVDEGLTATRRSMKRR